MNNNVFPSLLNVVEGVTTAALKYFFDPKEPVLDLKPLFEKPLSLAFFKQVAEELNKGGYQIHDYNNCIELVTTKGRRNFLKFSTNVNDPYPLDELTKYHVNWDELHKANMCNLWHWMQSVQGSGGYSAQNALYALKTVFALAESNRGRLVYLTTKQTNGLLQFEATFLGTKQNKTQVSRLSFISDDINWDLPSKAEVPHEIFVEYDEFGKLTAVIKARVGDIDHVLYSVNVEYLDRRSLLPTVDLITAKSELTKLPTPVILALGIESVTSIQESVSLKTGLTVRLVYAKTTGGRALLIRLQY